MFTQKHAAKTAFLMVLAVAASGCVSGSGSGDGAGFHALGENGYFTFGFAYDGAGVAAAPGWVFIDVDEPSNMGLVLAEARLGADTIKVNWEMFSGTAPFHSGGIAGRFTEHGDSGVGNPSIPTVNLRMAGWGTATVAGPFGQIMDPVSGAANWTAHFMVIENGVRNDTTQAIYKADGMTPFDPTMPGDGKTTPGDVEIQLVLQGAEPEDNGTHTETFELRNSAAINNAQYSAVHVFQAPPTGTVTLATAVTSQAPTAQSTELTFTVFTPGGDQVTSFTLIGGGSNSYEFQPTEFGEYRVQVTGRGVAANYVISGQHTFGRVTMNFWWEDVTFGADAEARLDELSIDVGHEH